MKGDEGVEVGEITSNGLLLGSICGNSELSFKEIIWCNIQ